MTADERVILSLLVISEKTEVYARDLVAESGGLLSSPSVFVHLSRLIFRGYVTRRADGPPPLGPQGQRLIPRSLYRITDRGSAALEVEVNR